MVRRVRILAGVGVIGGMVILVALAIILFRPVSRPPVDERPLAPRIPSGPTQSNAVVVLDQAWAAIRSTNELNRLVYPERSPRDRDVAGPIVAAERETLRLIHEAFGRPYCERVDPPIWTTNVVQRTDWGTLARLAATDAELRADGHPTLTDWNLPMHLVRLGHRLEDSGGTYSEYLNARNVKRIGLRLFQRWAGHFNGAPDELIGMARDLAAFPANKPGLTNAIAWEFQHGLLDLSDSLPSASLLYDSDRTRSLRARQCLALLDAIGSPAGARLKPTGDAVNRRSIFRSLFKGNTLGEILAAMSLTSGPWILHVHHVENNELGATRLILALRAYELAHGELPESLNSLVPRHLDAVPIDAFDGRPLRYSREQRKIWSVGKDLCDSGGFFRDAPRNRHDDVYELGW